MTKPGPEYLHLYKKIECKICKTIFYEYKYTTRKRKLKSVFRTTCCSKECIRENEERIRSVLCRKQHGKSKAYYKSRRERYLEMQKQNRDEEDRIRKEQIIYRIDVSKVKNDWFTTYLKNLIGVVNE